MATEMEGVTTLTNELESKLGLYGQLFVDGPKILQPKKTVRVLTPEFALKLGLTGEEYTVDLKNHQYTLGYGPMYGTDLPDDVMIVHLQGTLNGGSSFVGVVGAFKGDTFVKPTSLYCGLLKSQECFEHFSERLKAEPQEGVKIADLYR
jgi:hypothetical protein